MNQREHQILWLEAWKDAALAHIRRAYPEAYDTTWEFANKSADVALAYQIDKGAKEVSE